MKRKVTLWIMVLGITALMFSACSDAGEKGETTSKGTSSEASFESNDVDAQGDSGQEYDKESVDQGVPDDNGSFREDGESGDVPDNIRVGTGDISDQADGEYTLEYQLSYGYKDETEGRYIYSLDGRVTVGGEQRMDDVDWYNKSRPFVYAMYFPDLFGERVCQVYMDFALNEEENEVFINLPYDSQDGTFDNDEVLQYDDVDAVDNGGMLRINFPITISGMGTETMTITDSLDGFTFVFTLIR